MQPPLSDDVVVLDRHTDADVDAHLAGEDEEQARRFGWHPARSTVDSVRRALADWSADWASDGSSRTFAIRDHSGTLAGGCQVRLQRDVAELSYWVFPPFRRRTFATRALRLVSAWAFAELGVARLELHIEPDNAASRGAAEAAGFVEVGLLAKAEQIGGELRDMVLYRLVPQR